jgi:hypothetical protein
MMRIDPGDPRRNPAHYEGDWSERDHRFFA